MITRPGLRRKEQSSTFSEQMFEKGRLMMNMQNEKTGPRKVGMYMERYMVMLSSMSPGWDLTGQYTMSELRLGREEVLMFVVFAGGLEICGSPSPSICNGILVSNTRQKEFMVKYFLSQKFFKIRKSFSIKSEGWNNGHWQSESTQIQWGRCNPWSQKG